MSTVLSRPEATRRTRGGALAATTAYAALAVAMTWPLAGGLARRVPGDFGDPLLNAWILAWDARHILSALSGHFGALGEYWQANIFFPHPYTLAYSEHLTAQALQILPVYAATGNVLLCYNLLFLSTFVLSGLGAFLFARAITGSWSAAFVAGLAYAFAPYRFSSFAHVQVLSSQWMPFTLYALHRYFEGRRRAALAGAVAAFAAQALSCGYYLLFFAPAVVMFVAWEIHRTGRWRDRRTWLDLIAAGAGTGALVLPFMLPYLEVQRLGVLTRSLSETDHFGADVYGYLTADVQLRFWGSIARAWPKAEGSLFPGATVTLLAIFAAWRAWRDARVDARPGPTAVLLRWLLVAAVAAGTAILLHGTVRLALGPVSFKASGLLRVLIVSGAIVALLLASKAAPAGTSGRRPVRPHAIQAARWVKTPGAILTVIVLFSIAMSFGPHIHSRGRLVTDANVYRWFFEHVPGFDGVRAPARFAMIAALALAALAACAIALVPDSRRRAVAGLAAALIAAESWAVPIGIDLADTHVSHAGLAPLAISPADRPAIYDAVARTPIDAVLLELPMGDPAFDARAMFYSTAHWRRLVNGYSGAEPADYGLLGERVNDLFRSPEDAWSAVSRSGATCLLVHEDGYANGRGPRVSAWAEAHGARELAHAGADRLFALP